MTFTIHTIEDAPEEAKATLHEVKQKYGFLPNVMGVLAESPPALKAYLALEDLMKQTSLSAAERNIVIMSVSRENKCEYCMSLHSKTALDEQVPENIIGALRKGEALPDEKLEAFRRYTLDLIENHGHPGKEVKNKFIEMGYGPQQALEIVLGISMKTLSNFTNNLAHPQLDEAFLDMAWDKREAA